MENLFLIVLIGGLMVVIFDTVGSFASRIFGFKYQTLIIGSFLIYGTVGLAAAKYNGLIFAPLAAGIISLIDSTLGWCISWIIGPGRFEMEMNSKNIINTVIFVVSIGVMSGLIGGLLGFVI
jgi:hypothetical protein